MKKNNIQYVAWAVVFLLMAPLLLSSCDEEKDLNEWEMSYVYIQRENYTAIPPQFLIIHTPRGIVGNVSQKFYLKVNKPVTGDITVHLAVDCDGLDAEKVLLSQKSVTIKANESCSEAIEVGLSDYEFMTENEEEAVYDIKISIEDIEPNSNDIRISDLQNTLVMNIFKEALSFTTMQLKVPANSIIEPDRSNWRVEVLSETSYGKPEDIIDGNNYTFIQNRTDGDVEVAFDFGSKRELLGVQVNPYYYPPLEVGIFTSEDGKTWETYGTIGDIKSGITDITFLWPIHTQYLKYKVITPKNNYGCLSEFNIYIPKK